MAEVRYRGTKVVTVSPDYADNTKFADEWMPCAPPVPTARWPWRWAMSSSRNSSYGNGSFFVDYVRQYTDLPSWSRSRARGCPWCPPRCSPPPTWAGRRRTRSSNRCCSTGDERRAVPNGSLGFRYGDQGLGKWNLDLGDIVPALSVAADAAGPRWSRCRASTPRRLRRHDAARRAGALGWRTPRVYGVRPDAGPVRGRASPACPALAPGYDDPTRALPRLAGPITGFRPLRRSGWRASSPAMQKNPVAAR